MGVSNICQNWGVGNRFGWSLGGLEDIFHILRNMPASRAERKENWGARVFAGSNSKPQICNSCKEELALT